MQVGDRPAGKPGQLVADDAPISVARPAPFVSRGGQKLENALGELDVSAEGRLCLDVGASTGGFTDCLLQRGAAAVTALDVAYGELHWRIRQDPRVTVIERRNARELDAGELPYRPDLIVADVSFISLAKVLPAVLAAAAPAFDCLALVKPQFEVGRELVGARRRGALGGRPPRGPSWTSEPTPASASAPRSWATPRPASRARRATARASSGWPRPAVPAAWTTSRRRRGGPSRERQAALGHDLHPPAPGSDGARRRDA